MARSLTFWTVAAGLLLWPTVLPAPIVGGCEAPHTLMYAVLNPHSRPVFFQGRAAAERALWSGHILRVCL